MFRKDPNATPNGNACATPQVDGLRPGQRATPPAQGTVCGEKPATARPKPTPSRRAAIYAAASFHNYEASIKRQNDLCTSYIRSKSHVVVGRYADMKCNGRISEQLERCLEDARREQFDILVVEEADRLSRKLSVTFDLVTDLNSAGVEVHCIDDQILGPSVRTVGH